jgi:hypothetical protein
LDEFAANDGTSESIQCTPFLAVQGVGPQMSLQGNQHRNEINDVWMRTTLRLQFNRFTNTWGCKCDGAKVSRKKVPIENVYRQQIYKWDPSSGWTLGIYEQPAQSETMIGNGWALSGYLGRYLLMHMN